MAISRICTGCGERKSLDDFSPHAHGKYGKQPRCKACCSAANRARYAGPAKDFYKEKSRLRAIEDQRKNPDARNASRRKWLKANPAADKKSKRDWAKRNADALRAKNKAWHLANKEQNKAYTRGYRARKRNSFGRHCAKDIHRILIEQSGRCAYCVVELSTFDVDHVVPISRGGSNSPENLQLLCPSCNRSKNSKTHEEFLAFRRG